MRYGVATVSRLLKMQISFAKEPYQIDYILQKRPRILRSLLIVATPYVIHECGVQMRYIIREAESAFHKGWRRLIGSPKLQINFHKRATKYRSLLQKMTYKDK